jgi:hypothetical protein
MDGSKLGAHGTRILYISKDIAVFVLYQFSNTLLQYWMLDGHGFDTIINLVIITPSAVSIGLLLKYLYTCPFTETVEFQRKYGKYKLFILVLGRLAIIPIMLIMCSSLLIACLFSSGRHIPVIIIKFFLFVQFYGIFLELVKTVLLFMDNYYYQLSLFGKLDILCIGQLYKERIIAEQLVVNVDYAYRINKYLCGLITARKILNRDAAIKAKWIVERNTTEATEEYDVEINVEGCDINYDDTAIQNPLTEEFSQRESVIFSMDGIFSDSNNDEEIHGCNTYSNTNSDNNTDISAENPLYYSFSSTVKSDMITDNPLHSFSANTDNYRISNNNYHQETFRQSALNKKTSTYEDDNTDSSAADDDAALFLEYQNLQDNHDDAVMTDDNTEVAMSFEEWKIKRKQFKIGINYYKSLIHSLILYLFACRYTWLVCKSFPGV